MYLKTNRGANMNDALHVVFAIKPNPSESDLDVFEQGLKNLIPRAEDTHITSRGMQPTPELYPVSRSFDSNIGVYINYPDDCSECTEFYNNINTRLDFFSIESFMNAGGTQRLQDLLFLGTDAYSGELNPIPKHTVATSGDDDEYILYRVNGRDDYEWSWIWILVFAIILLSLCVWAAWDSPVYYRRTRPQSHC